jgi:hypothetical protein
MNADETSGKKLKDARFSDKVVYKRSSKGSQKTENSQRT